jgi:hypothetical protein
MQARKGCACNVYRRPCHSIYPMPRKPRLLQGSQAPVGEFDQLVEGPWPISTSCASGCLWGRASAFWREKWSKRPTFRARNFDQPVEDLFRIFRNFGPSAREFRPVDELASPGLLCCKSIRPQTCSCAAQLVVVHARVCLLAAAQRRHKTAQQQPRDGISVRHNMHMISAARCNKTDSYDICDKM